MNNKILEEIASWKLEAKLENNNRYFYHVTDLSRIESGDKCYVIGRKGTGKTAICEYLKCINSYNVFTAKLSFKNFPYNLLYEHENPLFTSPNQYITIWKYIIYISVAKLMIENQNINLQTRDLFEKIFKRKLEKSLADSFKEWIGTSLKLSFCGVDASLNLKKGKEDNLVPIPERVEILENLLFNSIDSAKYIILFDELDEDYKDIIESEKYKQYTALLTSLFKAVQDVKSCFLGKGSIFPVVFLRNDIYEIITDSDKTKWNDYRIDLNWDEPKINSLLAFRISRAIDEGGEILPFKAAWSSISNDQMISMGNRQTKNVQQFTYITRSSLLRPRDFVKYLQICAEISLQTGADLINAAIIQRASSAFSNYLRNELIDELHPILPEISKILEIFSQIRKQTLSITEFTDAYEEAIRMGELPERKAEFILKILFLFSFIGNQPKQITAQVFKYKSPEANLNFRERICVHRGFYKSLQLL